MVGMSDPHGWARTEHDTMVIPTGAGATAPPGQPYPGQPYPGQPYPGQAYAAPGAPVGPAGTGTEAAYWQAKYRRQRIWLGVVAGTALLALLGVVGLGFAAYQAVTSNPLVAAAQELGDLVQGGGAEQDQALPEGTLPESPEAQAPGTTGVPLPEPLQDLGAALGITDVGQLLDLAVAQGLMTQEQADALAAAIAMGGALESLGGDDEAAPEN
jgi:hypothetical protein